MGKRTARTPEQIEAEAAKAVPRKRRDVLAFSERLTWAIERCGMTRQELADALGKAPPRLSEWENGRRSPNVENLVPLVRALGVNAHWLLTGDGKPWVATDIRSRRGR